jgi:ADP-ribose diphosphatase
MASDARLGSHRVYSGRVINLDLDQVRYPDGSEGELEIYRHPGASAVVPILGDETAADPTILTIRQFRYATGGYVVELPAGKLDHEESALACARRELEEETGFTAERVEYMTSIYPAPAYTDERIHLFTATGLQKGAPRREADEFIESSPFRLSELVRMILNGEIIDAKTIAGIMMLSATRRMKSENPGT